MNLGINDIKEITAAMADYPDMDYSDYSSSFLKRRLTNIFNQLNIRRKETFIESLEQEQYRENIIEMMCVETTEMFRDPAFWRVFRDNILTKLPQNSDTIWLPHEPSGEEAFSLAILLHENITNNRFKIICNNPSIQRCRAISSGAVNNKHHDLNQSNYKRLEDKDNYSDYFIIEDGNISLNSNIRKELYCNKGFFVNNMPESKNIGCIIFRNNSIYYNRKFSEQIFKKLIDTLIPGGFLVIGVKEVLPNAIEEELIIIDKAEKIYQKPNIKQGNYYA